MLVWKLHTLDYRIASARYRAVLPMRALASHGTRSLVCRSLGMDQLRGAEALIFVKAFTLKDLMFAQRAFEMGVPIVLDLCDNIFVPNYTLKFPHHPAEIIQMMARYATVITTTGPALAAVLSKELERPVPVMTVTDGVESPALARTTRRIMRWVLVKEVVRMSMNVGFWVRVAPKLRSRGGSKLVQLWTKCVRVAESFIGRGGKSIRAAVTRGAAATRARNQQRDPVKTLIWFGHAGGEYGAFGVSDIAHIAPSLMELSRRISFKLLVVSNSRAAYEQHVRPLPLHTEYIEWDSESIRDLIKASDVTIVPNSRDPFAICKSANRAVLSLSLGVPVVASRTPAMDVLEACVNFDDWVEGPYRYLTEPKMVEAHLAKAKEVLDREFSESRIAGQWQDVLNVVKSAPVLRRDIPCGKPGRAIIVVIHLIQDFDLALPLLIAAKERYDLPCQAWVSLELLEASPRVWTGLRKHDIDFKVMDEHSDADVTLMAFGRAGAVVTIAETNQSPHRFPHRIVRRANAAGVPTYTMQHGFENIGLTYSDRRYPIEHVAFASNVILTWGPAEMLHPRIPERTRNKCLPVGCCKTVPSDPVRLPLSRHGQRVVGVFENLHWERYDCRYAERFVADVVELAERNLDIIFVVKPHHAGRWLTSRYDGTAPSASNLVIADPASSEWERFTASQLIPALDAVITTPSTVALDAARAGKPVAVVGYDLDLSQYRPLPILTDGAQWQEFVQRVADEVGVEELAERSKAFVDRTLCHGDAAERILVKIAADMGVKLAPRTPAASEQHESELPRKAVGCRT